MDGGITRFDRNCNQDIQQRLSIAAIAGKPLSSSLMSRFVLRADGEQVCKISFDPDVTGPTGKRARKALMALHADLKLVGIHYYQAHDMTKWRRKINKADSASKRGKR